MSTVNTKMTALADSIRTKSGESVKLSLDGMKEAVDSISVGIDTSDATATHDKIFLNETVYVDGEKVVGSFTIDNELDTQDDLIEQITAALEGKAVAGGTTVTVEQATPSISVNASGLITATATQTSGYVSAGTKSATKQLAFQPAKTITPSKSVQTAVSSGYYTGGDITVAAIPDSYIQPSGTLSVTTNGTHDVTNYASVNVNVAGGGNTGGDTDIESFVIRKITHYENNNITEIGSYAFGCCSLLTSVSFPACINIYNSAFYSCKSLTTASFPACTYIDSHAFALCRSLSTISFPACIYINSYAFSGCTNITTASFPVCTRIGSYAFGNCSSLTTVNFPVCTSIYESAFYSCESLTTVNFPACTSIGSYAFGSCSKLTSVSFPACKSIYDYAFYKCSSLTTANFPNCTTIYMSAFCYCTSLTTVNFPTCTYIGSSAFYSCAKLTSVSFPACTTIGSNAFYSCTSLTTVSLCACTSIGSYAFNKCYRLSSLTLGASTVCSLKNSNVFSSTPYTGYSAYFSGTPYIYVPSSLVDAYKSATNWTYLSSYFSAIENSGHAGGSD